ncbi:hypothetical protein [Ideonella paludis]|uniref:Uncharacterized protein n=1 Tax=Ideonella paludis TaxID=1233411 RepID=A0ABS5E1P8_9BURK|nr:hypothetical protein [Ideonella paludis]MBQ0937337.1 hypothetical protein [Ideonella paludis]
MQRLLVERVAPFTPGSDSATVTLRSAQGVIEAFCWQCELAPGAYVDCALSVLDAELQSAYLADWPEDIQCQRSVERLEKVGEYAYRGVARVVDQSLGLIEVLGFRIDVGEVPCDGAVEFRISRFDVR